MSEDNRFEGTSLDVFKNDHKKECTKNNSGRSGSRVCRRSQKKCNTEGLKIYSTKNETKSEFADRTIRSHKNILYACMKDFEYTYIHKLPQFIATMTSWNIRSIDKTPNCVGNFDFLSMFYSKAIREYKKPKFTIGARVCISMFDLQFRKC